MKSSSFLCYGKIKTSENSCLASTLLIESFSDKNKKENEYRLE